MNTHLKIGVIMDTSVDHTSSTVDFILGQGVNFPKPTDKDFACILFSALDELHRSCTLADIIGNHTQDHTCNYSLDRALAEKARESKLYAAKVRAKEIYKTSRTDKSSQDPVATTSSIYIACTRMDAYWLLVDRVETEHDGNQRYIFTQLDVDSMTEFFSHFKQYADHIGLQILRELSYAAHRKLEDWKEKQQRLEGAAMFLSSTSKRATSACVTPRTSGSGMEN
jgi:hypothetical protein